MLELLDVVLDALVVEVSVADEPFLDTETKRTGLSTPPWLTCTDAGVMLMFILELPPDWIANWTCTISFPLATTVSCVDVPSAHNALAPVMFRIIPVTLPVGTLGVPSSKADPWYLVMLTFVPMLDETL